MKKNGAIFMFVLICLCLIFGKTSAKAYVIGENEPKITKIQFLENGKILKTGDTLHVTFKTENVDYDTYYKCRVLFNAHIGNRVDGITIECAYNPSTGFYQGESVPISKEEMGETKYYANFFGFYNEHPGIYGNVLSVPLLSFVYSDNCYAGIHTGGEARCNQLARCKICQTEYGELNPHIEGEWKIIKPATGIKKGQKQKKCTFCGIILETSTIPKTVVKLNISTLLLQLKKSTTALKVTSISAGDKIKSWTSSNNKIVSVNKKTGKLTAKKTGKAKITVITNTGAKATCTVTVQKGAVKTNKLLIDKKTITLKKGKAYNIKVVRNPITANDKITYKTSNKKVVTVNSKGQVVAKKKGSATITVKAGKATVKIKVTIK